MNIQEGDVLRADVDAEETKITFTFGERMKQEDTTTPIKES
jgi:hypothetical protein